MSTSIVTGLLFIFIFDSIRKGYAVDTNKTEETIIDGNKPCTLNLMACELNVPDDIKAVFPAAPQEPVQSCKKSKIKGYHYDNDAGSVYGKKTSPLDGLCSELEGITGDVWVNPCDSFQVNCKEVDSSIHTCLITKPTEEYKGTKSYKYNNKTEPFWLSNLEKSDEADEDEIVTKVFELTHLYPGVTISQLEWLRSKSNYVHQTIRMHCKNSILKNDTESLMSLISWNDVAFGLQPTDQSPLFYKIGSNDSCVEYAPETEWRFSDMTVQGSADRLPVKDFYIKDTRNQDQSVFFELVELCFT